MVLVVSNRIPVAKEWEAEFERRWRDRPWSITKLPGFLGTEVWKPLNGAYYVVTTHWRTMRDFERWTKSAAFGESHAHAPPKEAYAGPNVFETHEVLAAKAPEAPARKRAGSAAKRT